MAEQAETPKILDEMSKKNQPGTRSKSKTRKAAGNGVVITVLLMLPLLVAVGFLAYQQRELRSSVSNIRADNEQLTAQLANRTSSFEAIETRLSEIQEQASQPSTIDDTAVRALEDSVQNQFQQVQVSLEELQSLQSTNQLEPDFEWKVFEAEYLLGVANQKLKLEEDIAGAIAMIEAADAALLASGSTRVFALRQAISDDLARLRVIEPFDRQGIYFQLGSLVQAVENIDLKATQRANFSEEESAFNADETNELGIMASSLEFLSSVFVWRRWDETPNGMLAPDQGLFIKQNLRLMLEQGQLALLMKDQTIFSQTLGKSRDWLTRYALIESDAGNLIVMSLTELAQLDINPALPSIDDSIDLVRQLTAASR